MTIEAVPINELRDLDLTKPYTQIAPQFVVSLVSGNLRDFCTLCDIRYPDDVTRVRGLSMFLERLGRSSADHFEDSTSDNLNGLQQGVSVIPESFVPSAINDFLGLSITEEEIKRIINKTSFLDCLTIAMDIRHYGESSTLSHKVAANQEQVEYFLNKIAPDWIKEELEKVVIAGQGTNGDENKIRQLVSRLKNLTWAVSKLPEAMLNNDPNLLDPCNPKKIGIFDSWNEMVNSFNLDSVDDGITIEWFSHDELVELKAAFEILKDFLA